MDGHGPHEPLMEPPRYKRLIIILKQKSKSLSDCFTFPALLHAVTFGTGAIMSAVIWATSYQCGALCPTTRLCATSPFSLFLLSVSRFTAGTFFASTAITMSTKISVVRIQIQNSYMSNIAHFDPHAIHQTFGWISCLSAFLHSICHIIRYSIDDPEKLRNLTSLSGIFALIPMAMICLIAIPRIRFEFRKAFHYAFIPLLVLLLFHSFHVMAFAAVFIAIYGADWIYLMCYCTKLVDEPVFVPIGSGTSVSFRVPDGFKFKAGQYVYVNAPWIAKYEWHAFSIIPATEFIDGSVIYSDATSFFAESCGDWTTKLFEQSVKSVRRPIWISPAFPSLADKVITYEKMVLVSTGIGVTPAISIIERYAGRKDIRFIWLCRDLHMISTFADQIRRVDAHIFYTGDVSEEAERVRKTLLTPSTRVSTSFWGENDVREIIRETVREVELDGTKLAVKWTYGRPKIDVRIQRAVFLPTKKTLVPGERTRIYGMQGGIRPTALSGVSERSQESKSVDEGDLAQHDVAHGDHESAPSVESDESSPIEELGAKNLEEWTVLYCGSSKELHLKIKTLCKDMGINFAHEFFKF